MNERLGSSPHPDEVTTKRVPGHLVCSSLADYVYERAGLATPHADRACTPWHWAEFIRERAWERV
jgi:hypothetical protein